MAKLLFAYLLPLLLLFTPQQTIPDSKRAADIRAKVWPKLQADLKARGLREDQPVYLRIIKETSTLQIWVRANTAYKLFKSYDICFFTGGLGTKKKDGDSKSPEGYYTIKADQLNPNSNYHLAINIGYPNTYDRQNNYTGSAIMIHGDCESDGCYAMTDPIIEEIYTMVYEAFAHGQKVISLDILPFKLNDAHLKKYARYPQMPFWRKLKKGYDIFEKTHQPAVVSVSNKTYVFAAGK